MGESSGGLPSEVLANRFKLNKRSAGLMPPVVFLERFFVKGHLFLCGQVLGWQCFNHIRGAGIRVNPCSGSGSGFTALQLLRCIQARYRIIRAFLIAH